MNVKIRFQKDSEGFHKTLVRRVENYFKSEGISEKANAFMYFKTLFFLSLILSSYFSLLFGGFSLWINNLLWVVLGLSSVFLAVNCGHDAIHGAYSSKRWINTLMSNSYNLLGANSYLWGITHNIVHHTYTNIDGIDEDIESVPFARIAPTQKWRPIQRYQHIWIFFLYPLGTLSWVFRKDYKKFFQKTIGNYENKNHPSIEYFNLFFFKALYYFLFIALPIMMIDMPWYVVFGGFILGHLFEGFAIAIIFMLAHVVEKADFSMPDEQGIMENNWAIHQLCTTVDFGRKSFITSFLTGGLNFQVEHHLFPKICHVHYPAISEIVKETALEYRVPYNDYPTFFDALKSHLSLLKKLGNNLIPEPDLDLAPESIEEVEESKLVAEIA
ncbi:MAG: acyl-CoA desaturase [Sporocytophaga sp.]|uniref:fatty acid desaturase family protein n=1 Tax=Sporocytophaga sp. TaxID=2231183 RepID=UPI001B2C4F2F|nr:acyl-CoA desaturase [Sporocytophaga sp.]MBO9703066.1 acyl-CoA desaturase [Sporocytophaga sp.]